MNDLVSIIVPCYNASKWIDDLFKSLDAQIYKNFEVIFVNDGSKDETEKILEDYCKEHKNCKYITQENQGVSVARNSGIALASGEYVCFVDPDDMISPNYVSRLHALITSGDYDCAVCRHLRTKEKQTYEDVLKIKVKLKGPQTTTYNNSNDVVFNFVNCTFGYGPCNKLYKTDILKKMVEYPNLFNKDIYSAEDFDFNYRYFYNSKKVIKTIERLYYYRQRKSSTIHQKFNMKSLTIFAAFDNNYSHCEENYPETLKYLVSLRICHTIGKLMLMKRSGHDSYEEIIPLINYLDENYKKCLKKSLVFAYPLMRAVFFSRTIRKHNKNSNFYN